MKGQTTILEAGYHQLINGKYAYLPQAIKAQTGDCKECAWAHPDTCKACKQGEKVIVLAVNKEGIKK